MTRSNYSLQIFLEDIKKTIKRLQPEGKNQAFLLGQKDRAIIRKISNQVDGKKKTNSNDIRSQRIYTQLSEQLPPESYTICAIAGLNARVGIIKDKDCVPDIKEVFRTNASAFDSYRSKLRNICIAERLLPLEILSLYG
jgi:hypothetical protein